MLIFILFVIQVLILVLLILLLYNVYKPTVIQRLFKKYFVPLSPIIEPERIIRTTDTFGKRALNSYYIPRAGSTSCLIWFHGGCFIQEEPTNVLPFLEVLSSDINVFTFDYPLPFDFTLDETLQYINKNLRKFFDSMPHEKYFVGGDSAGTFLAQKTYEREILEAPDRLPLPEFSRVEAFVGVCGFYDMKFGNNKIGEMFFNFYVLRGVDDKKKYQSTMAFPNNLLITSSSDFLNRQTIIYHDMHRSRSILVSYTTPNSIHCFIASTFLPETRRAGSEIIDFIRRFE
jgi:hypothetical protein